MGTPWLHRYAVALAVWTLFLVIAGASYPVSDTKSMGLHPVIGAFAGFLTVVLAIWLWRSDDRRWMRSLGAATVAAALLQGLLGRSSGALASILHACLAQIFLSIMVSIVVFTSPSWRKSPERVEDSGWPSLRSLAIITPIAVLGQVALGAAYRHGVLSVAPHAGGAIVVTAIILMVSIFLLAQFGSHTVLRRCAMLLISITCVQVVLGIAAYFTRLNTIDLPYPVASTVFVTVTHVATGALTLSASVALAIQVLRNVRPHLSEAAGHLSPVSR